MSDAVAFIKDAISKSSDDELRILIDGPGQSDGITKLLTSQGFNSILPEDDEGNIYLTASKVVAAEKPKPSQGITVSEKHTVPSTTGVLISCRNKEYNSAFMKKFLASLATAQNKPDVIGLLDAAVKISAYSSPLCVFLKKLEASGVQVLISESCADRLGMTEAAGAGVIADMSEILDEIFACGKVISI